MFYLLNSPLSAYRNYPRWKRLSKTDGWGRYDGGDLSFQPCHFKNHQADNETGKCIRRAEKLKTNLAAKNLKPRTRSSLTLTMMSKNNKNYFDGFEIPLHT